MSEKLLITQALDERDLLVKKINDKIAKAKFVDTIRNNEENVYDARIDKKAFAEQVKSAYQQIRDLVNRFVKIDQAITTSNANTKIKTSYGDFTVAGAISLRNRLRGSGTYKKNADFEGALLQKMQYDLNEKIKLSDIQNQELQRTADNMRLSILGRDSKNKDDKPLEVVQTYINENTTVVVDPLDVRKTLNELIEKRDTLLQELDTQIKVSNATTFIEI